MMCPVLTVQCQSAVGGGGGDGPMPIGRVGGGSERVAYWSFVRCLRLIKAGKKKKITILAVLMGY